ncbi:hypothetical protein OK074_2600 [Actinobacteria bacterium OK074]|nr:hypothetical protein OK074_2600 [Actinobacteria bacterium OK074]
MSEPPTRGAPGPADPAPGQRRVMVITRIEAACDADRFAADFAPLYRDYLTFLEHQDGLLRARRRVGDDQPGVYYELSCWTSADRFRELAGQPEFTDHLHWLSRRAAISSDITHEWET